MRAALILWPLPILQPPLPNHLAQAFREWRFKKNSTQRTRYRQGPPLKYEDLRVGMRVRVLDDREFVEAECERVVEGAEEHVEWTEDMAACVGVEGQIKSLNPDLQAAGRWRRRTAKHGCFRSLSSGRFSRRKCGCENPPSSAEPRRARGYEVCCVFYRPGAGPGGAMPYAGPEPSQAKFLETPYSSLPN